MMNAVVLWILTLASAELFLSVSAARSMTLCLSVAVAAAALVISLGMELLALNIILFFCATALLLYMLMLSNESVGGLTARFANSISRPFAACAAFVLLACWVVSFSIVDSRLLQTL